MVCTPSDETALDELEQRVGRKWAEVAAARMPQGMFSPDEWWFGGINWSDWVTEPLPPDVPQFPREQWARYPAKRTVCLLIADRLLDFDELSDEQWMQLCLLMQYGGKTRLG